MAIGYPACPHYDRQKLEKHTGYEYLRHIGLSLLFITSGEPEYESEELVSPSFKQGRVRHKAPTSKGMSGGPLLKIEGDGNVIHIFGCITSGDDDDEKGCY